MNATLTLLTLAALSTAAGAGDFAVPATADGERKERLRHILESVHRMSAGSGALFNEAYDGDAPHEDGARLVLANDLSTPSLTPTLTPTVAPRVEPVVVATPPSAVQPIAARPAFPALPSESSCDDLRRKAERLRSAASQCDADVAGGAPYCNVTPRFDRPNIPKSLSAESARGYADDFERYADSGDERACAAYGGQAAAERGVPTAGKCVWSGATGNLALIIGVQMSVEEGLCKDPNGQLSHKSRQCMCAGVGIGAGISSGVQTGNTLSSSTSWSVSYGPCGVTNWGASCGFGFDVGAFRMNCRCNVESRN